jgi:probable rRNA maturation factor
MIVNRQSAVTVSPARLGRFLAKLEGLVRLPAGAVTVCLVTEPGIARLNRAFRGRRGSTDVLSFPAGGRRRPRGKGRSARRRSLPAGVSGRYWGDIAIAPVVARRNARRAGRAVEAELRMLVLHGVLHLMGYDHETDYGEMARRELRLRRRLGLE